jgi:4-deoxy-L-threo-5-hexosulose-uronate ketol-isomerase
MKLHIMADPHRCSHMTTHELRSCFLVEDLFVPGEMRLAYCDADRAVVGAAVPTSKPLTLGTDDALRSAYFTERRELGVLNIGAKGTITVEGMRFELNNLDCLYIGRGNREIQLESASADAPAQFYLLSYPAHVTYPNTLIKRSDVEPLRLGAEATCNKRALYKYIHPNGIKSCQLVMGFTQMEPGSAWNTMPPHTHLRRSEVYLYFNIAPEARVFHFMGEPTETRHLVVADKQAVLAPSWSIHAGVGTTSYAFCWGMGGENQAFDDMDQLAIAQLK